MVVFWMLEHLHVGDEARDPSVVGISLLLVPVATGNLAQCFWCTCIVSVAGHVSQEWAFHLASCGPPVSALVTLDVDWGCSARVTACREMGCGAGAALRALGGLPWCPGSHFSV